MPIKKSAIKALKQSKKRHSDNQKKRKILKGVLKSTASSKDLPKAQSAIDKIAKTNVIHKNKAARLKSRLAKKLKQPI